jgi:hypothetical protein
LDLIIIIIIIIIINTEYHLREFTLLKEEAS